MREIGTISNEYGSLNIGIGDGSPLTGPKDKPYWEIDGYGGWSEEIPQYLYDALNRFQDEQEAKK
jgi:hypothetical protein